MQTFAESSRRILYGTILSGVSSTVTTSATRWPANHLIYLLGYLSLPYWQAQPYVWSLTRACQHIANGVQRFYVYFDPKVSLIKDQAWQEALRLWQESIDRNDDSIATACAGVPICTVLGVTGKDKHGNEVLTRVQQILLDQGLYDSNKMDQIYGDMGTWRAKTRSQIAWSVLDYVT
jgi:hypothetical protein